MKTKSILIGVINLHILVCFFLISCSGERDYEFVVYNTTNYKINSFKIDNVAVSIEPNDTSERVTWCFGGTYFNFTEPLVGLCVASYSDSVSTFKNNIGDVASIPDLNKKSVNKIVITLLDEYWNSDYIFDIKVNK